MVWGGGGKKKMVWGIRVSVFNFLDNLLYYGYNTDSNTFAWKGGLGLLTQNMFY